MNDEKKSAPKELRRSERIDVTIPIRVFATDPRRHDFTEEGVAVNVSRHGARIRLERWLTVGDVVRIRNLKNNKDAAFRVVSRFGELQPDLPQADWGVEILNPEGEIWGVELRDNPLKDTAFSAVLQCTNCKAMSSFLLTYEEEQAARAAVSFLTLYCPRCQENTLWKSVR